MRDKVRIRHGTSNDKGASCGTDGLPTKRASQAKVSWRFAADTSTEAMIKELTHHAARGA